MNSETESEVIVFVERNTFNIDFPRPIFPHEWIEYDETSPAQVVERLAPATLVICNKLSLRAEHLTRLPRLKLIAVAATGVDNIDLEYCREHRIAVCNTRGYAVTSVPEHALMLMLALRRNLVAYRQDVQNGAWQNANQFCLLDHPISDLHGSTLGIVGYGRLGKSMAELAKAIGMNVLIAEHKQAMEVREGRTAFNELLQRSDVVSLHCPLTEATRKLIGRDELVLMKREAVLINTARGALLDDESLLWALNAGEIAGAGIDVLKVEPPRDANLLLDTPIPNLIITPHNAWASRQAMETLAGQLIENLEAFVRGEPRNLVG